MKKRVCALDSYIIEGDVTVSGEGCRVLLGLTISGSVNISAGASDAAIVKCMISGGIISAASSVVIRDCQAESISLASGSVNVLVARIKSVKLTCAVTMSVTPMPASRSVRTRDYSPTATRILLSICLAVTMCLIPSAKLLFPVTSIF